MTDEELLVRAANAFEAQFGAQPEAVAYAPGRVNLLGEHTDYNGGLVVPMPLNLGMSVAIGRGPRPGVVEIYSETMGENDVRPADDAAAGRWSDYVLGSLQVIAPEQIAEFGCTCAVVSTLPVGAGLSSSAALEVASLRAASELFGTSLDTGETARLAQQVENDYVGVPCGIMDHFAASAGVPGRALLLDTRNLAFEPVQLPYDHRFVIVHSGISHQLMLDGYSERVEECEAASAALGVAQLSDLGPDDLDRIARLTAPLDRRARHIVTENQRVKDGVADLAAGEAPAFGRRMIESHLSQRDDFEVSIPEVDSLVNSAMRSGALGARLTGGGFGGAIVALVRESHLDAFCEGVVATCPDARVLAIN